MLHLNAVRCVWLLALLLLAGANAWGDTGKNRKDFEFPIKWEFRLRSEVRENFDLREAVGDDNYPLLQRFRLSVGPRWKSFHFLVQIQDSPVWFKNKSPYSSADFHLYQLYLETPFARGFRLRVGRQEFLAGQERLLGVFGWDNRGRSFDAISLNREGKSGSLRLFAANLAAPRQRNFPRGQNLFGLVWSRQVGNRTLETYAFWLHDQTVLRGEERFGRTRILTSGARFTHQRSAWKHNVEVAGQVGRRNNDPHLAAAFTYRGDYAWGTRFSPALGFEYSFATGDGNARDKKSREFHNLYPTNHAYYGYMDLFGWRNVHNPRIILEFQPSTKIRLEGNYHDFWLAQTRGAWKNASGGFLAQDRAGHSGRRVGGEVDLLGTYTLSSHWRFLLGYSSFFPGDFARATRGSQGARFAYLQLLCSY